MTSPPIRPATEADLPRIQELNFALFAWDRERDPDMNFDWPYEEVGRSYFLRRIGGNGVCLVAEVDGAVVGYLAGGMREERWRRVRRSELENMYVAPEWRRHGVGRALVAQFFRWSKDSGAEQALVEAFWGNDDAVAFYRSSGFDPIAMSLNARL